MKHGLGRWTDMIQDPEFAPRLQGHKATQLRNRWKKLGTATNEATTPADRQLAAKREEVFDHIAATTPPTVTQPAAQVQAQQQQMMQQQMMQQQQQQQRGGAAAGPASSSAMMPPTALLPPQPFFTAYRPYPTHVFDQPKSTKTKKAAVQGGTAADAQLSTPMDLGAQKPKKRGRKPKNPRPDEDDNSSAFSDADSEDSEAAERAAATSATGGEESSKNEFKDLEGSLACTHTHTLRPRALHVQSALLLISSLSLCSRVVCRESRQLGLHALL